MRFLRGPFGLQQPTITWRQAILSLQGETTVVVLPHDPVAGALREIDLFETHEYESLDGIGYSFDIQTRNVQAHLSFANPEVPSLRRLAWALLKVGQEIAGLSESEAVTEYIKAWAEYVV